MERLNFKVFEQFWTLAKSYWMGDEKWRARGLLLGVILFLLAYTGLSVVLNNKRGVLISALSAKRMFEKSKLVKNHASLLTIIRIIAI